MECPLCGSQNASFNFLENKHSLYSCQECNLHFIDPYIQNEINRNPLSSERQYISEKLAVKYYFPNIKKYFINQDSHLDIGCGCGELLKKSKELGTKLVVGLENDLDRASFARKNTNCLIIEKEFDFFNEQENYSVITLINVISHLTDLNLFFNKTRRLLEPKGKLIIKTGLIFDGFKQKNGFDWQIPEHVHFFGNKTPEYSARKFGFNIIEQIKIPISNELISKEYLLSPGRNAIKNLVKKTINYIPLSIPILRRIYNFYTGNKMFTLILVLEKK